jgi:hypothetical protein
MLSEPHTLFLGIDPTGAREGLVYVALDAERRIFAIGGGRMSDVLAFAAGQGQALVAVNAPSGLNLGLTEKEEVQQRLFSEPEGGQWTNLRVAEVELNQLGLESPQTGAKIEDCPAWMQRGFSLYQQLGRMGYSPYPSEERVRQWIEVSAKAIFNSLAEGSLFEPRGLEGRLQRQLILHNEGIAVQDPMDFFEEVTRHRLLRGVLPYEMIYRAHELNALAAAYTGWLAVHQPERVLTLGIHEKVS